MKSMKLSKGFLFLWVLSAILIAGCTPGKKGGSLIGKRATGLPFEVVVVSDPQQWKGALGEAVRNELEAPYPALPQWENVADITYCTPQQFDGLMRYVRNILIIDVNDLRYTKITLASERDVWADGQLVLRQQAPNASELETYLAQHKGELSRLLRLTEQERYADYLRQYHNAVVQDTLHQLFGLDICIPEGFDASRRDSLFLWISNNANSGRMDMAFYSFPAEGPEALTVERLVAMRDSVMKQHIAGSFDGSYMATERQFDVQGERVEPSDTPALMIRGLWRMEGDMMGGPFVQKAIYDKANRRVIVAEGFVYSPESLKKNYIHRLASSLCTARLLSGTTAPHEGEK